MKPITEWTVEDVRDAAMSDPRIPDDDRRRACILELLRRERESERERCARVLEAEAVRVIAEPADEIRTAVASALWGLAARIRGLQ